jgi:membrane protein YdbS with pleckstrin-like domain
MVLVFQSSGVVMSRSWSHTLDSCNTQPACVLPADVVPFASAWQCGLMLLRDPVHLVSPRAVAYWTVRALPAWIIVLAGELLWLSSPPDDTGPRVVVPAVTVLLAAAHLIVMPRWRYRVHRWEVTSTAVYTQSGWLRQERRIAPLSRVQTVDTERGPLEQLFMLANVTVTTASAAGPLRIHGLDRATAGALVAELTEATSHSQGDAT